MKGRQKFLKILENFKDKKAEIFINRTNLFYFERMLW